MANPKSALQIYKSKPRIGGAILIAFILLLVGLLAGLGIKRFGWQLQKESPTASAKPQPSVTTSSTGQISLQVPKQSSPNQTSTSQSNDVQISSQIQSSSNGKIKGNVTLTNTSGRDLAEVYPTFILLTPQKEVTVAGNGVRKQVVLRSIVSHSELGNVKLAAGEVKTLPFEVDYSSTIEPGQYQLQSAALSRLGDFMGLSFNYATLKGTGSFLEVSNCNLVVGNQSYDPQEGPLVDKGGSAQGRCTLTNTGKENLSLHYRTDYAILFYLNYPQSQKLSKTYQDRISIGPGETETLNFPLPTNLDSQVYEGYISLLDDQGVTHSPLIPFRWTIKGASGRIGKVDLDKDYYAQGEEAKVAVIAGPSPDLFWTNNPFFKPHLANSGGTILKDSKLTVTITDNSDSVCGTSDYNLPRSPEGGIPWNEVQVPVTIQKNCINPKADVKLIDSGKLLAESSKQEVSSQASIHTPQNPLNQNIVLGSLIAAVFILIAVGIILMKRRGSAPIHGILLLIIPSLLAASVFILQSKTTAFAFPLSGSRQTSSLTLNFYYYAGSCGKNCTIPPYTATLASTSFGGSVSMSGSTATVTLSGYYGTLSFVCGNGHYTALDNNVNIQGTGLGTVSTSSTGGNVPWSYTLTLSNPPSSLTYDFQLQYDATSTDMGHFTYYSTDSIIGVYPWGGGDENGQNGSNAQYGETTLSACYCNGNPANTCQGSYYADTCGRNVCPGNEQPACVNNVSVCGGTCDTTPPSVTVSNPPADTCYRSSTGTNGTPWANTEPIQVKVDDTKGGTVISSGISNVSIKVTDSSGNVTRTVNGSLVSGTSTNGTYSVTIPADTTSFPINGSRYSITAYATDNVSHTSNSAAYPFTYDATGNACVAPHIQTQNGDVHSQTSVGP